MTNRRSFLAFGASAVTAAAQTPTPPAPATTAAPSTPFTDPDFGFTALITLGGAYYGQGDPGKLLAITSKIKPGDSKSAWQAYYLAGVEMADLAAKAAAAHHKVSAREAYLCAAAYFNAANRFLDGTDGPGRMLPERWQ